MTANKEDLAQNQKSGGVKKDSGGDNKEERGKIACGIQQFNVCCKQELSGGKSDDASRSEINGFILVPARQNETGGKGEKNINAYNIEETQKDGEDALALGKASEDSAYKPKQGEASQKGTESERSDEKVNKAQTQIEHNTLYLVTGAQGFIGREICETLCAAGKNVRALVRKLRAELPFPQQAAICLGDLLDIASLERFFEGADGNTVVIHSAAVISVKKKSKACLDANICGTKNIIDLCIKHKVKKLVYLGSVDGISVKKGEMHKEPSEYYPQLLKTDYAKSKAHCANLVLAAQKEGLESAVILPSAVIGPNDYKGGFITHILKIYTKGGLPRLSVKAGYDFVDVRDVAEATVAACQKGKCGSYILSNGYLSITEVFDAFARRLGRKPTLKTFPIEILYPFAAAASFFYLFKKGEPLFTLSALNIMKIAPAYCHQRATEQLGFNPRPIEETLNDTADFLLATVEKERASRAQKRRKS